MGRMYYVVLTPSPIENGDSGCAHLCIMKVTFGCTNATVLLQDEYSARVNEESKNAPTMGGGDGMEPKRSLKL
jgi:hypothetical protein